MNSFKAPLQEYEPGPRNPKCSDWSAPVLTLGVVQERLGHSSAAFTMQVYGHASKGMQEQAAEAFAGLLAEAPT